MKLLTKLFVKILEIPASLIKNRKRRFKFVSRTSKGVKRWYYVFPFNLIEIYLTKTTNKCCEHYSKDGGRTAVVEFITSNEEIKDDTDYHHFIGEPFPPNSNKYDKTLMGRSYKLVEKEDNDGLKVEGFWICPMTFFMFGRYPEHIYTKKKSLM